MQRRILTEAEKSKIASLLMDSTTEATIDVDGPDAWMLDYIYDSKLQFRFVNECGIPTDQLV